MVVAAIAAAVWEPGRIDAFAIAPWLAALLLFVLGGVLAQGARLREDLEAIRDKPQRLRRLELTALDAKAIRERLGMSQSQMATFLDVSPRTLRNWEQGRRQPTGAPQTLLRVMGKEPAAVMRASHGK